MERFEGITATNARRFVDPIERTMILMQPSKNVFGTSFLGKTVGLKNLLVSLYIYTNTNKNTYCTSVSFFSFQKLDH